MALMLEEEGYERLLAVFQGGDSFAIAAATLVEAVTVSIRKQGSTGPRAIFGLIDEFDVTVVPTIAADAEIAAEAYARFGKGQGHPAQLNFGDCFTYALAKRTGRAIFCVGDDFAAADLPVFPPPPLSPQEAS